MQAEVRFSDEDFALLQKALDKLKSRPDHDLMVSEAKKGIPDLPIGPGRSLHSEISRFAEAEKLKDQKLKEEVITLQAKLIQFKNFTRQPCEPLGSR